MNGSETRLAPRAVGKADARRELQSKVPQVTIFLWVIKILCTTVGETASDFLNVTIGFGLKGASIAAGLCLLSVLIVQFTARRYIPGVYWLAVVLISIFGTLITDILSDSLKIPLEASTFIFSVTLGLVFAVWYANEKTLSIHSSFTRKREAFYWLTILFTFALGTATGDLVAEKLGVGYLATGLLVVGVIAAAVNAHRFGLDSVLAFWIVYVLTRPLGASIGDYLSQPTVNGGVGLGATLTSTIFLSAILATVVFLALTRKDAIKEPAVNSPPERQNRRAILQTVVAVGLLLRIGITGY